MHCMIQRRFRFLDENFIRKIFSNIYTNDQGEDVYLSPLEETTAYMFDEKQPPSVDRSKVFPFDLLNV